MLPLMLNLAGRLVVVVGGGSVGQRKAKAALAGGADKVRIVNLHPAPPEWAGVPRVEWLAEPYRADHLAGAALVFAASIAAVNEAVVADAKARDLWVCDAAEPAEGNCVVPAAVRRGPLVVSVSTQGAAPALAKRVREKLEADLFDESFGQWVELLGELRPAILNEVDTLAARQRLFDALADWPWLERVRRDGIDAVRAAMWEEVRKAARPL